MKFPIRFDSFSAALLTVLGCGRRRSGIEVTDRSVDVRLGWSFSASIDRRTITRATHTPARRVISRGAHGWSGRWLVNGAGRGLVTITVDPAARARVLGVPVSLRELTVSAEDPDALVAALGTVD